MCNVSQDVMDKFSVTIENFLDSGQMFTAYDVTIATRERESMKLRHQDCRGAAHEVPLLEEACDFGHEDKNGNSVVWKRSSVSHPQSGQAVFVYHPETVDPSGFRFRGPQSSPVTTTSATAVASAPTVASPDDGCTSDGGGLNSDGSFSTDYRNRLLVRQGDLRDHLNLNAGDTCHVIQDSANNRIVLAASNFDASLTNFTQRVGRQSNFYLSSGTLRGAGLNIVDSLRILRGTEGNLPVVIITQFKSDANDDDDGFDD